MSIFCTNSVLTKCLAANFDVSDSSSWDGNQYFSLSSTTRYNYGYSSTFSLPDYGLTQYDVARVDRMYSGATFSSLNNSLQLDRIGYNDASGNTYYTGFEISTGTTVSGTNYFILEGGYFQNFFKLEGLNYELLPPRYNEGFTLETLLYISGNSFTNNGFFIYLGARAEDKYEPSFSGETTITTLTSVITKKVNADYGIGAITTTAITEQTIISGVTTTSGNTLYQTEDTTQNTYDNVIGFRFTPNGKIGYRKINASGIIEETYSDKTISSTGWTLISIVFKPYELIKDIDLLDCLPNRYGDLTFYVNGRKFFKLENFEEIYFKRFNTTPEKQIGVPYNISWGGGSFGLKYSYHYDFFTRNIYLNNDTTGYTTSIIDKFYPEYINNCNSGDTYLNIVSISGLTETVDYDDCDVAIDRNVMTITNTGNTTGGSTTFLYLELLSGQTILSNRVYELSFNVKNNSIFSGNTGTIKPFVYSNNNEILILSETPYTYAIGDVVTGYTKTTILFKTEDNVQIDEIFIGIIASGDTELVIVDSGNTIGSFNIDNFYLKGQDKLIQNPENLNKLIEKNFSGSFIGGIQKLRFYLCPLTFSEILHNSKSEILLLSDFDGRLTN